MRKSLLNEGVGESKQVGVRLGSIVEWKVVDAINRGVEVRVKSVLGEERILVANMNGGLCYMEGNEKKLMDVSGWYLDEDIAREIQCGGLNVGGLGLENKVNEVAARYAEMFEGWQGKGGLDSASLDEDLDLDEDEFDYDAYTKELTDFLINCPNGYYTPTANMIDVLRGKGVILRALYQLDSNKFIVTTSFSEERKAVIFADLISRLGRNCKAAQDRRWLHISFYGLKERDVDNLSMVKNLRITKVRNGQGGGGNNYGGAHYPPVRKFTP